MSAKGLMPGKKGITLMKEQWDTFRDAFFDIDDKCVSQTLVAHQFNGYNEPTLMSIDNFMSK